MPKTDFAAPEPSSLLDGRSLGELIPELARHGLQQLIELEFAAVLGADRHKRTEARLGYRNGNIPRNLTTQVGDSEADFFWAEFSLTSEGEASLAVKLVIFTLKLGSLRRSAASCRAVCGSVAPQDALVNVSGSTTE